MLLDARGTLKSDIGKGGRANHSKERERMARCRYQDGCLFIRGRKRKMWVARWREDVIQSDGAVLRVLRSETLGPVSEIAGRREARILLQNRLASLNSGQRRAEATMTFGTFVAEQFEPDILPTLKYATQKIYSLILRTHLLPPTVRHHEGGSSAVRNKQAQRRLCLGDDQPLPNVVEQDHEHGCELELSLGQPRAWGKNAGTHARTTAPLSYDGTGEAFDRGVRGIGMHNRLAGNNDGAAYWGDSGAPMGQG